MVSLKTLWRSHFKCGPFRRTLSIHEFAPSLRRSSPSLSWRPTRLLGESSPRAISDRRPGAPFPPSRATQGAREPPPSAPGLGFSCQRTAFPVPRTTFPPPSSVFPAGSAFEAPENEAPRLPEQSIPQSLGSLPRPPPLGGGGKDRPTDPKRAIPSRDRGLCDGERPHVKSSSKFALSFASYSPRGTSQEGWGMRRSLSLATSSERGIRR